MGNSFHAGQEQTGCSYLPIWVELCGMEAVTCEGEEGIGFLPTWLCVRVLRLHLLLLL